jgi:hypothetical protein
MSEVTTLITNVGFPIACVLGCAYFIWYMVKQEREENAKREERYLTTIDKFTDVLEKVNENLATNNKRLEYIEKKLSIGSDE